MKLKPYMGFCGDPLDGAVLVIAHSARDARRLAYRAMDWCDDWIDVRVRLIRGNAAYCMTLSDPTKLAAGLAHVVDDPPVCPVCETWGNPIHASGKGCDNCEADLDA